MVVIFMAVGETPLQSICGVTGETFLPESAYSLE